MRLRQSASEVDNVRNRVDRAMEHVAVYCEADEGKATGWEGAEAGTRLQAQAELIFSLSSTCVVIDLGFVVVPQRGGSVRSIAREVSNFCHC